MEMRITFPGGKKVNAEIGEMVIATDQPQEAGGTGSAPTPYDYFLASIGTCAGFYVLSFCQKRGIPTDGITLRQRQEFTSGADGTKRLTRIAIEITVPADFPEKYRNALIKSAATCAVKKAIIEPPQFAITTRVG